MNVCYVFSDVLDTTAMIKKATGWDAGGVYFHWHND